MHRLACSASRASRRLFDKGELAEYAPPDELLADPNSQFSGLVDDTGSAAAHLRALAAEAAEARALAK